MNILENLNVNRFLFSLQYMWQGMLSIFLVIFVIIASVAVMNKLTNRSKKNKEENK